ncbi:MAG: GC-type dockerin domain-anchored protein [Phycisphaerales bacterium]
MPKTAHRVFAASLALLTAWGAALADDNNQARAIINADFTPMSPPVDNIVQHPGYCSAYGTGFGGFDSTGEAWAQADYGYAVLQGQAHGSLNAGAYGIFRDSITITAPGIPTGTPGTITFAVNVTVTLTATTGSSGATWNLSADIGGGITDMSRSGTMYAPSLHNPQYVGDAVGTYTAVGSFQYGMPSQLIVTLQGGADAAYGGDGAGNCSFTRIVASWAGLTDAKANGVPVSGWTVTSQSGTNWGGAINPPSPCAADVGTSGGQPGNDGVLDNNDFIAFITYFFNNDPHADMGQTGGVSGQDGLYNNNDFIAFINAFFAGC